MTIGRVATTAAVTVATPTSSEFCGFRPEALQLLAELAEPAASDDGNRHAPRRQHCQELLLDPARALIIALAPRLRRLSPGIRAEPRIGGSILRLHRDARFARGSPFKDYLELWLWEGDGSSRVHPGFFVRLTAVSFTVGAGLRRFPSERLLAYRRAVDQPSTGQELRRLLQRLERGGWAVHGHVLQRVPAPYSPDHERSQLLRRTGLWTECRSGPPDELFGPELTAALERRFRALLPLHRWLARLQ